MVFKFNLLRRSCFFLKRSCHKRTLYLSMVRSLVEHCNQVWSNLSVGSFKSLEKLQKRAVKWIRNEPLASYTNDQYVEHLLSLNLLPFKHLFQFYDLRLFYKIMSGMVDISFPDSISPVNPDSLRPTRQNLDIIEGRDVTTLINSSGARSHNVLNGSFFHRTTILWNKLPYEGSLSCSNCCVGSLGVCDDIYILFYKCFPPKIVRPNKKNVNITDKAGGYSIAVLNCTDTVSSDSIAVSPIWQTSKLN
eukprot:sb/3468821/